MLNPYRPGDRRAALRQSPIAEATGTEAAAMLKPGSVYTATVMCRQADGTYTVFVEDPRTQLHGVLLAFPVIGGLLGWRVRSSLTQNTVVKLVYGSPSFVFAVIPEKATRTDRQTAGKRSLMFGDVMDPSVGVTDDRVSDLPDDMLEGEVEFANLYGVALEMLTTLIRMKASDRAVVECHMLNDMVRVISSQYRHISGLGEDLIFDHGRPTMERNWSSYRHEVLGALKESAPVFDGLLNGDEVNRAELNARRITAVGRYRLHELLGFAGDFIHSFVSDPPETVVAMTQDLARAGAGKSWLHRNSDGSVVLQSVADIRLERVCRIPVPIRTNRHEDPTVTTARAYDELTVEMLKLPKLAAPTNPRDSFQMAYHIRSYSRWLSRYHSLVRVLQLEGEYKVESEYDSPTPDWCSAEADKLQANPAVRYMDSYACITILRDGSIVLHDGYGSAVVMSNGNVQVSASRHLDLEAAGDIRMVAGGSILAKAQRNVEIAADKGGLILYGYAWLKGLCEKGSLWLRSNAKASKDVNPADDQLDEGPVPEIAGWQTGSKDGYAVLIEGVAGSAALRSEGGILLAVDGSPANDEDKSKNIVMSSAADVDIWGARSTKMHSAGSAQIGAAGGIVMASSSPLLLSVPEVIVGSNVSEPGLILRRDTLHVNTITTLNLSSNHIAGPKVTGRKPDPDPEPKKPVVAHLNHIQELRRPVEVPAGADDAQKQLVTDVVKMTSLRPEIPWSSATGPSWGFPPHEEYAWDPREELPGVIPETLTQQFLRLDQTLSEDEKTALQLGEDALDRWGSVGYSTWELKRSISGTRTLTFGGFGSHEEQFRASDEGDKLRTPSDKAAAEFADPAAEWRIKDGGFKIKALKRPPPP